MDGIDGILGVVNELRDRIIAHGNIPFPTATSTTSLRTPLLPTNPHLPTPLLPTTPHLPTPLLPTTPRLPALSRRTSTSTSTSTSTRATEDFRRCFPQYRAEKRKRKGAKKSSWDINMFCLNSPNYDRTPTSREQTQHLAAGLGKRRVSFEDQCGDHHYFLTKLYVEYPKLEKTNGSLFLYKASSGGSGSRSLEGIPPGPNGYTISWLKNCGQISNCTVFIKPLQVELALERIDEDLSVMPSSYCINCNNYFTLLELEEHAKHCITETRDEFSNFTSEYEICPDCNRTMMSAQCSCREHEEEKEDDEEELPRLFAEPAVPEPAIAEATVAEPAIAATTVAEPPVAEPDVLEPAFTERVVAEPAVVEPETITIPDEEQPAERSAVADVGIVEINIDSKIDEIVSICIDKGLHDPVQIIRCMQNQLVQGRPLETIDASSYSEGATNFILVDRDDIIKSAFDEIKALSNKFVTLEVQFYDEVAADFGGPRKEFFALITRAIKEKFFDNGLRTDMASEYYTIGTIFGLSILQNGVVPQFLGADALEEIFSTDVSGLQPCFKELQRAFADLGIYQVIQQFPSVIHIFRPNDQGKITFRRLILLLKPEFAETGSNTRKFQNQVYRIFSKYLREASAGRRDKVTLSSVLRFFTGAEQEPLLGFGLHPSLIFTTPGKDNFIPTSHTCINQLQLPRATLTYDLPNENILFNLYDLAFCNTYFGRR